MGQAFSEPVTEKESSTVKNDKFLVASSSIQGWRISMEDAHTIMLSMPDDPETSFFAVFDGHGGAKVANYASENLHQGLCSHRLYQEGRIDEALKNIFIEFDEMMFNDEKMRDELAGSTAVVILIKDCQIYCANIGDSRAVASFAGQVDPLSIDHKPTCEEEMNRIVSAGGWVQFNRVNGNLALSRAFGDFVFKRNEKRSATEQIVIAYPDVQTRTLSSDLEFIIMACDGVWDVMTNEEVVEFIRRRVFYRREPVAICEELITRCLAPDCQMGCGIGCDNMTVILICYLNGSTYEEFCDRVSNVYTRVPCLRHIIGPITQLPDHEDQAEDSDNSSDSSVSSSEIISSSAAVVAAAVHMNNNHKSINNNDDHHHENNNTHMRDATSPSNTTQANSNNNDNHNHNDGNNVANQVSMTQCHHDDTSNGTVHLPLSNNNHHHRLIHHHPNGAQLCDKAIEVINTTTTTTTVLITTNPLESVHHHHHQSTNPQSPQPTQEESTALVSPSPTKSSPSGPSTTQQQSLSQTVAAVLLSNSSTP